MEKTKDEQTQFSKIHTFPPLCGTVGSGMSLVDIHFSTSAEDVTCVECLQRYNTPAENKLDYMFKSRKQYKKKIKVEGKGEVLKPEL